jgi:pyruvate dehydrogenase E1 component
MATPGPRPAITAEGLSTQIPDIDPEETSEWLESLDGLLDDKGKNRARFIMLQLLARAREHQVGLPALRSSDYINTIPPESEPWFPATSTSSGGSRLHPLERRDHGQQGQPEGSRGRRATSRPTRARPACTRSASTTSSAARTIRAGGDHVFIQGHASAGIYARPTSRVG